jgi:glycosyltransferase involved in cell wall biosynthesis
MPALSCCIIVKNEAHRLQHLLRNISSISDQIVVVDTGSTDNTVQVAGDMGAEVTLFPWIDSFSDARNKSLECASHPWVFYLDADDYLPESSLQSLKDLKKEDPTKAYYSFVIRSTQDGITGISSAQIRMFPNMEGLKFRYRVHEQIRSALIQKGIPIVPTDIEVIRTGYTDRRIVADKQRRNLELLKKDLADCPRDGFLHYLTGMAWLDLKNPALAKDEFIKAWELSVSDPEKRNIALGAALELADMTLKKRQAGHAEALRWLERAESLEKEHPRCLYLRGRLNYEKGYLEKALKPLKYLMECQKPSFLLPLDITMLKTTGAALMGQIYLKTGRPQEAVAILNQAELLLKKSVTSQ